jgi:hypothetical protein
MVSVFCPGVPFVGGLYGRCFCCAFGCGECVVVCYLCVGYCEIASVQWICCVLCVVIWRRWVAVMVFAALRDCSVCYVLALQSDADRGLYVVVVLVCILLFRNVWFGVARCSRGSLFLFVMVFSS